MQNTLEKYIPITVNLQNGSNAAQVKGMKTHKQTERRIKTKSYGTEPNNTTAIC